jgi:hypothetical protein
MADIIQIRRDTAANWTSANPILAQGELGVETDTDKIKIGDGSTAWTGLGYIIDTGGYAVYADTTANFTGTLQNGGSNVLVDTDIGSTVQAYDATIVVDADIGVTVQGYDATILVDADIGVNIQGYDANTAKYDDTTANFTGTLQNGGSNVVLDTDIGSTVQAYDANTTTSTNTQTLTNKTIRDTVYALSGTAFDATNGAVQTKTLAATTTFTDSLSSGDAIVLQLEAGASYTVTWPTMTWVTSGGNVAPTLTAKDTLVFWKVSSILYGAYTGSYV